MKPPTHDSLAEGRQAQMLRELRIIKNLLASIVLLLITVMSSSIDRDLPLIILPAGILLFIGWTVFRAVLNRSQRARRETEALRVLSGRAEMPTR